MLRFRFVLITGAGRITVDRIVAGKVFSVSRFSASYPESIGFTPVVCQARLTIRQVVRLAHRAFLSSIPRLSKLATRFFARRSSYVYLSGRSPTVCSSKIPHSLQEQLSRTDNDVSAKSIHAQRSLVSADEGPRRACPEARQRAVDSEFPFCAEAIVLKALASCACL